MIRIIDSMILKKRIILKELASLKTRTSVTVSKPTTLVDTVPISCILVMLRQTQHNTWQLPIFSLSPEMQDSWDFVMGQMLSFVDDTHADIDSAYDFVCEQLGIDSFVDKK